MIVPPLSLLAIPTPAPNPLSPSLTNLQSSTNFIATLLSRDTPECTDISSYRTTVNIVLSCLSTIFACTWVALHQNVPESKISFWRCWGWNSFCLLTALIAPELVVWVAIKERLRAQLWMDNWNKNYAALCSPDLVEVPGKTVKQYKKELNDIEYDSRWTLMHGFFADMGGIRLHGRSRFHENFKPTEEFFKDPQMRPIIQQIGLISSEDIADKSKGDWICKFFVVMQTTWFIVQCLARWATGLPVTELEIVTLAYAVQNIIIWLLWWDKPKDLSVPYRFYYEKDGNENPGAEGDREQGGHPVMSRQNQLLRRRILMNKWVQPTYSGVQGFFMGLVPENKGLFIFALPGCIFGCLHTLPIWPSLFPSHAERILWRISAFCVTAVPIPAVFAFSGVMGGSWYRMPLLAVFVLLGFIIYPVARFLLLVLPLITLRSLPEEALLSVKWTSFIPHF